MGSQPQTPVLSPPPPSNQENSFSPDSSWETAVKKTNDYAAAQRCAPSTAEHRRPWKPVSFEDIMVFVGALIYMGVHREPSIEYYWSDEAPIHTIPKHMGLIRFQQIKRYLHVGDTLSFPADNKSQLALETDAAVVNAHKLQRTQRRNQGLRPMTQSAFREKLYIELFQYSFYGKAQPTPIPEAPATRRRKRKASDIQLPPQRLDRSLPHTFKAKANE